MVKTYHYLARCAWLAARDDGQAKDRTPGTETTCDGVVLAASPRPDRNITGALADHSPGVIFVQPLAAASVTERSQAGRSAARAWIAANR
jgi:hypothetical protein